MQPDDFGRSAYVKVAPHSVLHRHTQFRLGIGLGEDRLTQRAGSEPALGGCLDDETISVNSASPIEKISTNSGSNDLFVLPEGWRYDSECYGYMAGWLDQRPFQIPSGYFL